MCLSTANLVKQFFMYTVARNAQEAEANDDGEGRHDSKGEWIVVTWIMDLIPQTWLHPTRVCDSASKDEQGWAEDQTTDAPKCCIRFALSVINWNCLTVLTKGLGLLLTLESPIKIDFVAATSIFFESTSERIKRTVLSKVYIHIILWQSSSSSDPACWRPTTSTTMPALVAHYPLDTESLPRIPALTNSMV